MKKQINIGDKIIGDNSPCFIIAEMSGNHNLDYNRAEAIVRAAAAAGVDAIKLQTYTADTMTLNSDNEVFNTEDGGLWEGQTLYKLYQKAYTPWEWQPKLKKLANDLGMILFSTPFDVSAVRFLEQMDVPAYKVASFEMMDTLLLREVARTGKPIIMSAGIATIGEIQQAVDICREEGNDQIVLLKCTSAYPAPYEEMNLKMIPSLENTFECIAGLSDHSLGDEIAIASIAMGAKVVEKHFTLKRSDGGVDCDFSMEAEEMKEMVRKIRNVETAMGKVDYTLSEVQKRERHFGRSLFTAQNIKKGEIFTSENIRSVRPANGLAVKYYDDIIGKKASHDLEFAKPLELADIEW
jgi:pseudaminic acid synthase